MTTPAEGQLREDITGHFDAVTGDGNSEVVQNRVSEVLELVNQAKREAVLGVLDELRKVQGSYPSRFYQKIDEIRRSYEEAND